MIALSLPVEWQLRDLAADTYIRHRQVERLQAGFIQIDVLAVAGVQPRHRTLVTDAGRRDDVDVAVLFAKAPPHRLNSPRFELAGELERALGRPVDLIVLNDAPADLAVRILRTGILVLDAQPSARIAFEVRTRNEAFDLEPMLAAYRAPREHAS